MKRSNGKRMIAVVASLAMLLSLCGVTFMSQKEAKAAAELSNPSTDEDGVSTWDCIYFGSYPQSTYTPIQAPENPVSDTEYTDSDGTKMLYQEWEKEEWNEDKEDYDTVSYQGYFKIEPIKWRVLSVNENDVFLLADCNIDCQSYNKEAEDVTWETCTLRTWLNDTFLSSAFASDERANIINTTVVNDDNPNSGAEGGKNTTDKVYLLSIAEAGNAAYGFNGDITADSETRVAVNTAYTASYSRMSSAGDAEWWWLRSPGDGNHCAANVGTGGYGYTVGNDVSEALYAVRPAMHVSLNASTFWEYAGKVSAEGGDKGAKPTPTPTVTPAVTEAPSAVPTAVPTAKQSTIPTLTPGASASVTPVPSVNSGKVTAPAKVTLKSVKNKKGKKVIVKWKKVNGADGYQIQYARKKTFKGKKSVTASKTSYTIKKLKKKKTYYVRVRAYKKNGQKKEYGKWSAVKKVRVKK